ncbi:MAG TPA: ATP-binding protein [Coleofasciculaceae cyanobacterium]|jgi:light-regulated signal transduction histidine kinase (bacteriophytochrome)
MKTKTRKSPPSDELQELLTKCDQEPIHLTHWIQPHGLLLAVSEQDWQIRQLSRNTLYYLGIPPEELVNQSISKIMPAEKLQEALRNKSLVGNLTRLFRWDYEAKGRRFTFDIIAHRTNGLLILELEESLEEREDLPELDAFYKTLFQNLEHAPMVQDAYQQAVAAVRLLTGFDRVMLYRFDEEGNGAVVAESAQEGVETYLGLHYPASDIPKQARELYLRNWTRIVPAVNAEAVPLWPALNQKTGESLDLSFSTLRSLSPVHIEYLKNMKVQASMSISLIKEGKLWGLIACHHLSPRRVSYRKRMSCEFLGQIFSLQLALKEDAEILAYRDRARLRLQDVMDAIRNGTELPAALLQPDLDLPALVNASGVAIVYEGAWHLIGKTPGPQQVLSLVSRLSGHGGQDEAQEVFAIRALSDLYPEAESYKEVAAGVLGFPLSQAQRSYILWFRPEEIETIHWAGNPNQPVALENGEVRLHPRKSFELWKETVRGKCIPWTAYEIETLALLHSFLLTQLLTQTSEELAEANRRLSQSNRDLDTFAFVISHDLRGMIRRVQYYTGFLEEDLSPLPNQSQEYLTRIRVITDRMDTMVSNVLEVSRVATQQKPFEPVDLAVVVDQVLVDLHDIIQQAGATVERMELPTLEADEAQMYQLFQNLIGNALKYHRENVPPQIRVSATSIDADTCRIAVRDNGLGFPPEKSPELFEMFRRLKEHQGMSGSGIGLAICKRIVERHHGSISVDSVPGQGSIFYVDLPRYQNGT